MNNAIEEFGFGLDIPLELRRAFVMICCLDLYGSTPSRGMECFSPDCVV
jgi:hypothetical protein